MKILRRIALLLFGLVLMASAIYFVIIGTLEPTSWGSIRIILSTTIAVPIGIGAIFKSYRMGATPRARDLQTEAEAKDRVAKALADAETAENIKLEMQAYVLLRARYLERERRRMQLFELASSVVREFEELNELERLIGVDVSRLSSDTVLVLDKIMKSYQPSKRFFPDSSSPIILAAEITAGALDRAIRKWYQKRMVRRQVSLAPDAISSSPTPNEKL